MLVLAFITQAAGESQEDLRLTREEYPVVSGSTSTMPLGALIAGRVTRTSVAWQQDMFSGERRLVLTTEEYDPSRRLVLDAPADRPTATSLEALKASGVFQLFDRVVHHGTSQSIERLSAKDADLILIAREPTPDERALVKKSGANPVVIPIARDAFVFLRNASNPVKGLTLNQVRDIYAGAITNWQAVGGPDWPITAYQRDAASGSQVEMEGIMGGRKMISGPDIRLAVSMFGPFNALRSDDRGIGYSYHYYERYMAALPQVTTFAIDGVEPNPSTIANSKYPLVTNVYLVHRSDLPAQSAAARLRDWILSRAGQAVVEESGYVKR